MNRKATETPAKVRVYEGESPDAIPWRELRHGPLAEALIGPYLGRRSRALIANTNHRILLADVDGQALPLVVNDGEDSECYLTSPHINHIVYALDFVRRLPQRGWRWLLHGLVVLFAALVRRRDLDRVVYVNHWLVATGPRYALSHAQLDRLKTALLLRFPDHAIVARGVRAGGKAQHGSASPPFGWCALFNRSVYVWPHDHERRSKPSREFRQDRRRLDASRKCVRESAAVDASQRARLKSLYEQLYLDKYSHYNPQLDQHWFDAIVGNPLINVHTIDAEGDINYFVCSFETDEEMIGSVVGHQPKLSKRLGLYRMGVSLLMRHAAERSLPLNLSSGSGQFKSKRGAEPVAEHDWYYVSHLSWRTRHSWRLVAFAYNHLARPLYQALRI